MLFTSARATCSPPHVPATLPLAGAAGSVAFTSMQPESAPASGSGGGVAFWLPPQPARTSMRAIEDARIRHIGIVSPPISRKRPEPNRKLEHVSILFLYRR